jgi:LmbE family N-acetylglucosaminyl deacetylase
MQNWSRFLGAALIATAIGTLGSRGPAQAQITPLAHDQGATGLGLALRHLPNDGSVLMVTAHPDDENNGLLVKVNRGLGIKTSLLTVTRGDGGQNEIGPELFQAIGILRGEELAAVHRFDAADQYFTRAYEFGYSFSDEETFQKWGREQILEDVVRVVRKVRPDVIITMPRQSGGGGQHHQAAAQLGHEAFHAAADPKRFPDQIKEGLMPWQARKSYESGGGFGRGGRGAAPGGGQPAPGGRGAATGAGQAAPGGGQPRASAEGASRGVAVQTGDFDPLLGMSWNQFGALARMAHLCQGMGQLASRPGPAQAGYVLVHGTPAGDAETDILDGIDFSLTRLARFAQGQEAAIPSLGADLETIVGHARQAADAFDVRATHKTLPHLAAGLTAVRALTAQVEGSSIKGDARNEILWRLARKEQDFVRALGLAQGLVFHAVADDGNVVRGQTFNVTATVFNTGVEPVQIADVPVTAPKGWAVERRSGQPGTLKHNESLSMTYAVTVGPDARYSQPYWKMNPKVDRYDIEVPEHHTLPWSPPEVMAAVRYMSAGVAGAIEQPAHFRYEGPWVGGEKQKVVNIVPALSVKVSPGIAIIPQAASGAKREFRVTVLNNTRAAGAATVRLELPAGWRAEPQQATLPFTLEEEELTAKFAVTPPAGLTEGEHTIKAVATRGGETFREGYQVIAYDHIQTRHLFHPAESRVQTIAVTVPATVEVGYIMGSGDDVPAAIEQLGARLTMLTPDDVAFSDLSRFTTIVTGIRAYEKRPDLRAYNQRLLDFVRAGGHLVVQYNKTEANQLMVRAGEGLGGGRGGPQPTASPFFPYPGLVSRDRITVEETPVRVLVPGARELNTPNRITEKDLDGWVQERGLYFFGAGDARYVDLLAATDPWPNNPGEKKGLLTVAPLGQGTWAYVGLGLWRQLPAGTPGAYRILANLISKPRAGAPGTAAAAGK